MYATCFGPFSGLHQACQYKSHLKKWFEVYICNTAAYKVTTSIDTYSIFGLHFNVWITIIRDGRQHFSYAQ